MATDIRRLEGGTAPATHGAFWHLVPRTPTPGPGRVERRALCGVCPRDSFAGWGPPTPAAAVTCATCAELGTRPAYYTAAIHAGERIAREVFDAASQGRPRRNVEVHLPEARVRTLTASAWLEGYKAALRELEEPR